jgi:hypothetical protein
MIVLRYLILLKCILIWWFVRWWKDWFWFSNILGNKIDEYWCDDVFNHQKDEF